MKLFNKDMMEVLKKGTTESIDCCVTDCPYKIIAGGVRIINEGDECSGVLSKRKDWSKTDPKGCLNRGRRVMVSDGTDCSNKWLKKNEGDVACAVKDGKMFTHNDLSFSDWLPELFRVMKNGTHTYIMINSRNLTELQLEAEICGNSEEEKEKIRNGKRCKKKGFIFQNLLVWQKGNFTPNKYYMQGAEFILMLRKGKARNINDMGSKNIISVPNIIGKKEHPTEKPVELMEYLIRNSTNEGDIVLDPFMGAGSTGIACKNLNRKFIGIEIDEEYFDIAQKRINN